MLTIQLEGIQMSSDKTEASKICGGCMPAEEKQLTIGEAYDQVINGYRKSLEAACIAKAKAEALGMLDHPHQDLRNILGWVI